ncbi:MAG: hypothetical protein GC201_08955 [Alphaproteobacteria bacterium]|nr:hypothetical protein [Alphaproteobacteria bacterium]
MADRVLPFKKDRDTGGFFAAADRHELVYRACNDCGASINPPHARCAACGSWNTGWKQASGKGRLFTWSVVEQQIHPAFPTPYTIVVVALEDDPSVRYVGYLDGAHDLKADMAMRVRFEPTEDGGALPQWIPDNAR